MLLSVFKYVFAIFLLDLGLTLILKVVILQNTTITATDFLIPGFLAGAGLRMLKIAINLALFLPLRILGALLLVVGMDVGIGVGEWIETLAVIISDLFVLVFDDLLGFLDKYLKDFNILEVMNRVAEMFLGLIESETGVPVLAFFKGLIEPVIVFIEVIKDRVTIVQLIPIMITKMISGLLFGGVTRFTVDYCMGAFQDYGEPRGGDIYLKGVEEAKYSEFVKLDEERGTAIIDGQTANVTYTYKSFVSEEAKNRWLAIQSDVEGKPPYTKDSWVEWEEGEQQDDPNPYKKVVIVVEDEPYLTESEKTSISEKLAEEGSKAYNFVKDTLDQFWRYRHPR